VAHEVVWAQSAVADLLEAVEYIAKDSPSYAAALATSRDAMFRATPSTSSRLNERSARSIFGSPTSTNIGWCLSLCLCYSSDAILMV
jgi:hypothetical protein